MSGLPDFQEGERLRAEDLRALAAAATELKKVAPGVAGRRRQADFRSFAPMGRVVAREDASGAAKVLMVELLYEGGSRADVLPGAECAGFDECAGYADGVALYGDVVTELVDADEAGRVGCLRGAGLSLTAARLDMAMTDDGLTGGEDAGYDVALVVRRQDGVTQQVDPDWCSGVVALLGMVCGANGQQAIVPARVMQPLSFNAFSYRVGDVRYRQGRFYWMGRLDQHGRLILGADKVEREVSV